MNSHNEDEESVPNLSEVIANIVGKAQASGYQDWLKELIATSMHDAFAATAMQTDDYSTVIAVIQQSIQDVEKWKIILQEVLRQVEELEASQARQVQYSERWWQWKQKTLYETLQNDPLKGLYQWLRTYAKALIAWELGMCEKLANEPFPFPLQAVDVPTLFQKGTQAIIDEKYQQALDMLACLTKAASMSQLDNILKKSERATLLVFMGRIFLYKISDSEAALNFFEQAQKLAPENGRPNAALGEYYRLKNEREKAMWFYKQAIELSSKQPDGYIGKGLLYEDQELWDEADDCYEEAMEVVREGRDIEVALNKLIAPISGNVYLQLARVYKKRQDLERALQAVTRALSMGIKDQGEYPERIGYRLQGEILELLERRTEAAQAHFEAGRRFGWRNELTLAVEILTHANELNPSYIPIYWQLSETLRISSYQMTPPYVDQELIKKSLATWEQGYTIEPPSSDYSWAYIVRALINEQLARLPNAQQWALWWEAITYVERAIVLSKANYKNWIFLGRYYRFLRTDANALQATSKAIDYDPDDLDALDERAAILANVGEFDAAEEVIAKRQKMEENIWIDAVKAFILIHKGSYKEALEILQRVLQATPDEIWYHSLRGLCYLMLDEPQRAREDYEWIWNHFNESDSYNQAEYGWAAYNLGKIDEAIKIFNKKRNDPIGVGNTYWDLGLCYLTRGDLLLGEENLERGIARLRNVRELDGLLNQDIYIIEKSSANWLHGAQIREVLARIKEKMKARRNKVMRRTSVEEELKEVIKRYSRKEGKINWYWIGVQAGLARFYREKKRWSEAAEVYLLLQREGKRFPEAHYGLEKSFDELQAETDARVKEGKPRETLEQLLQMSKLELLSDDKTRLAQLYSRLGYVYFDLADIENARKYFAKALQIYRENGSSSPGSALSEVCQTFLRNATQYWALNAQWKAMAEEQGTDEILQNDLIIASKSLTNYLDEFCKLPERFVDRTELLPVVTPIVLEIGDGLIPADTSQEWSLFKSYIPEMRQRFQDKIGVSVPGIRVRTSNILSPEGYLIMLDEAEIERGSVYLDMRYCPTPPETIQALGVPKRALIEKPHPVRGEPGCWISQDGWDLIVSNNLELWAEPLVFIIHHLEALILRNLTNFMGTQDVENLLAEWRKNPNAAVLIASALPAEHTRYHFGQILRALVREQVPITFWKDILEVFREAGLINVNVSEAVRIVRLRLKEQLPGNNPKAQRLELPMEWEDMLISGLEHRDGRTFLTLPPEKIHEFLSTIRNVVKARDWNLVLVTQGSEIRPFVWRLVENEFPYLMVLAQDELVVDQAVGMEHTKGVVTDAE